jgi:hypothetical protein
MRSLAGGCAAALVVAIAAYAPYRRRAAELLASVSAIHVACLLLGVICVELYAFKPAPPTARAGPRKTVAFSSVSLSTACELLESVDASLVDGEEEEVRDVAAPVADFLWSGRNESDGTAAALMHIGSALAGQGVVFGRGGYRLLDTHSRSAFLRLRVDDTLFAGSVDALIVPHGTAAEGAAREARVAIELKTKTERRPSNAVFGQVLVELLATNGASRHPVIVLLTDGTSCSLLRLGDGVVTRWAGRSMGEGLSFVAKYLNSECARSLRFTQAEVPGASPGLWATRGRCSQLVAAAKPGALVSAMLEQLDSLVAAEGIDLAGGGREERARAAALGEQLVAQWRPRLEEEGELPWAVQHMFA